MDKQQETAPSKNDSLKIVDSVLENMMKDISFGQSFLSRCQDIYKCYPKAVENRLVSDIVENISSLEGLVKEASNVLAIYVETWDKTAVYFRENLEKCNMKDNPSIDCNTVGHPSSLITQKNLAEIIHTAVLFSQKAERSTRLEQIMFAEIQEYIDDLKEAVCNISNDMKVINSLKQEIQCASEDTLNEVNKHLKTANVFYNIWKHPQGKQVDCKPICPATTNMSMRSQASTNIKPKRVPQYQQMTGLPIGKERLQEKQVDLQPMGPTTASISMKSQAPLNIRGRGVSEQPKMIGLSMDIESSSRKHSDKHLEDIVYRFDQMSSKARQELQNKKEQNEGLQQTATAVKKNQETGA